MGSMESMEELRILPQYRLSYREVAYLGLLVFNFEEEQEHEQDFGILPHYRLNDREVAFLDVFLDWKVVRSTKHTEITKQSTCNREYNIKRASSENWGWNHSLSHCSHLVLVLKLRRFWFWWILNPLEHLVNRRSLEADSEFEGFAVIASESSRVQWRIWTDVPHLEIRFNIGSWL